MDDSKQGTSLRQIIKWVNVACALTIIVMTIIGIVTLFAVLEFWNWIFAIYQFIFAILIIAAEFKLDFILKYFRFLEGNIGKGWFLIFCGMWMIGKSLSSLISGCCLIGCGILTIFILSCTK